MSLSVTFLTGGPGSGKTTLAAFLEETYHFSVIDVRVVHGVCAFVLNIPFCSIQF